MKTLKEFLNTAVSIDESHYMRDIANHDVGDTIHPYSRGLASGVHRDPHAVVKKSASKTVIQNLRTGEKYDVSHATGRVKNQQTGDEEIYSFGGFDTPKEKAEHDERKKKQHEKDAAHDAIVHHLSGLKNSYGHAVGKLSPEDHAEILTHLEKLKE